MIQDKVNLKAYAWQPGAGQATTFSLWCGKILPRFSAQTQGGLCWTEAGIMRSACLYGSCQGLCWAQVVPMLGQVGPMLSHLGPILGLCWAKSGPCWAIGPILGLYWPRLGLCWAHLGPMLALCGSMYGCISANSILQGLQFAVRRRTHDICLSLKRLPLLHIVMFETDRSNLVDQFFMGIALGNFTGLSPVAARFCACAAP